MKQSAAACLSHNPYFSSFAKASVGNPIVTPEKITERMETETFLKVALIPLLPFGDRLVFFRRILPLLVGTTLVPKWPRHALFFYKTYG
jgi:hypothetical protein